METSAEELPEGYPLRSLFFSRFFLLSFLATSSAFAFQTVSRHSHPKALMAGVKTYVVSELVLHSIYGAHLCTLNALLLILGSF